MTPADCDAIIAAWRLSPQCEHKLNAATSAMTLLMCDAREQTYPPQISVRGEPWAFDYGRLPTLGSGQTNPAPMMTPVGEHRMPRPVTGITHDVGSPIVRNPPVSQAAKGARCEGVTTDVALAGPTRRVDTRTAPENDPTGTDPWPATASGEVGFAMQNPTED